MTQISVPAPPGSLPDRLAALRPVLTPLTFNAIFASYLVVVLNGTFWLKANRIFAGAPGDIITFGAAIWALTFLILSLVTLRGLHRPAVALIVITAAVADYYQSRFGILIDREMIQNAMLTTVTESKHLITGDFLLHIGLFGLLPAALAFWPRLRRPALLRGLWQWPLTIALTTTLVAGLLMTDFKTFSAAVREHRDMLGAYQPGATLGALSRYAKMQFRSANQTVAPLGRDARPGPLLAAAPKPVLTVIFVGETARAQNFGLDGYARDTTPELRGHDLVNFPDVTSCGTSTAVSLPCMFSPFATDDYSQTKFLGRENLLDVLAHAGLDARWVDNNTGDQRIALRTGATRIDKTMDPAACAMGECTDAALLPILARTMADMTGDTVLVLHMIGSHGPAYHLRYPPEFERFTPACTTADFARCTTDEIVNAYDNSILFTDHVLSQAIALMTAQDQVIPAMIYMSDHGESLGEGGLYLHAAPMFMAPDTQRKVPFLMWFSEPFKTALKLDQGCIARRAATPVSHDNLFHTVLGLMDITTTARDPALDLTSGCRLQVTQ